MKKTDNVLWALGTVLALVYISVSSYASKITHGLDWFSIGFILVESVVVYALIKFDKEKNDYVANWLVFVSLVFAFLYLVGQICVLMGMPLS